MTTVGVLRETAPGERRVALTPDGAGRLCKRDVEVLVEAGAGDAAWFDDGEYLRAGAITVDREKVYAGSEVLLCLHPPEDIDAARPGQVLVGLLGADPVLAVRLAALGISAISLDLLPRTLSRAHSMDALTSQAGVAGYKAAVLAAEACPGLFPMLTTVPAQVLVLGAGAAGLQAIVTAARLGAMVTGYDARAAARADIASTGAAVLDLGTPAEAAAAGGYAQRAALERAIPRFDVVITTAAGRPPLLVTAAALAAMRPGSVVLDLACGPHGGTVAGSVPNARIRTDNGVTVIGAPDLAATAPAAASTAYSRNLLALLALLMPDGTVALDLHDEIQAAVTLTHHGWTVPRRVRAACAA